MFDDCIFEEIFVIFDIAYPADMMRLHSLVHDVCSLHDVDIVLESMIIDYDLDESWIECRPDDGLFWAERIEEAIITLMILPQ